MHRQYGWTKEQISDLINATESVWDELGGWEIIKQCADEVDLLLWNEFIQQEMLENGYKEWIDDWKERKMI